MTRYYCEKCGYKMEKEAPPHRCPYCSREGTLKKEKTAQELLDEVANNSEKNSPDNEVL